MVETHTFIVLVPTEDNGLVALTSGQFTETQRRAIEHMARNAGVTPPAPGVCGVADTAVISQIVETSAKALYSEATRPVGQAQKVAASLRAKNQGYTGNACTSCGGFNVKRNGSCEVCTDCGSTTGCS